MVPHCGELVATDISDALLREAAAKPGNRAVRFVRLNLEAIDPAELGRPFEAVFGCSVLHHLDLDTTLPQLAGVLAPGADLAFSEPNLLNPQVQLMFSRFAWHGFQVCELFTFDFMHPGIPARLLPTARRLDRLLERTPVLRLLGGSCFIHARWRGR
jgi:trans-aconitate methyltransferase